MSISNIERNIRFSNLTLDEYNVLHENYTLKLLETVKSNPKFLAVYEATGSYMKPKAELKRMAEKLAGQSNEKVVSDFGKAVLTFLAKGAQNIDRLFLTIVSVALVGGAVLATCINLIIGIILFAILVVPHALLVKVLAKMDNALGKYTKPEKDVNIKKLKKLSINIQKQEKGIKDIEVLDKIVKSIESVDVVKEHREMIKESQVQEVLNIIDAIENKMDICNELDICHEKLNIYSDLCPQHMCYTMESDNHCSINDETDLFVTLESIVSKPLLSGNGLITGMIAISTDNCNRKTVLEFLNRYKNTVLYEMRNDKYNDIPILMETGLGLNYIRKCSFGSSDVLENCDRLDQLLGEIVSECEGIVKEEGFNPDPFSLGSLTPMPVAQRAVDNCLCDLENAETDEEIKEAVIKFARIHKIINESYYMEEADDGQSYCVMKEGVISKTSRKVETSVNKVLSKKVTKDKSDTVKASVKKVTDPMVKFIENSYQKIKMADKTERREIIMKGGIIPKTKRLVKRALLAACAGGVSVVCPMAGVIGAIGVLGLIGADKHLDKKERNLILKELDDEIMICNEKIDDSRGDEDKKKKYELMRIRNALQRQRDKVQYNLSH